MKPLTCELCPTDHPLYGTPDGWLCWKHLRERQRRTAVAAPRLADSDENLGN